MAPPMTCTTTCRTPRGRQAHCGACHHTFSGVTGFDRHRRNDTCLNPADLPMHTDAYGIWREDGYGTNPHSRPAPLSEPQTDENAPA